MPKMGIDCSRGRIRVQSRNGADYWPHTDATVDDLVEALRTDDELRVEILAKLAANPALQKWPFEFLQQDWLEERKRAEAAEEERDAVKARLTELEQRLARVAQLAHDRNDDSHEWRSRRLGQCASIAWDHMEESFSKDPLKRRSTLKWAHLAQQLADVERERDDLKARLSGV